jgi:hypothetical protein
VSFFECPSVSRTAVHFTDSELLAIIKGEIMAMLCFLGIMGISAQFAREIVEPQIALHDRSI